MEEIRAGHIATICDVAALPDSDAFRASTLQQGIRSTTIIPMVVGDQVIGQLTIHRAEPGQLPAEVMEFVAHVADSLAVALSNAQLAQQVQAGREQLQALARRLVELQEQERSHVANQLYNEANQVLAVLLVQLSLLEKALAHGQASAERLSEMKRTIDGVIRELHYLATHLRPASLDQLGLVAAVEQYLRAFGHEHGLEAAFAGVELKGLRPPAEVETALYRIVQEALANVAEHAQAGHVSIALTCAEGRLVLCVEDDGVGFDLQAALRQGALGLVGIRERAEAVGGRLEIESAPRTGTTILVEVPLKGAAC